MENKPMNFFDRIKAMIAKQKAAQAATKAKEAPAEQNKIIAEQKRVAVSYEQLKAFQDKTTTNPIEVIDPEVALKAFEAEPIIIAADESAPTTEEPVITVDPTEIEKAEVAKTEEAPKKKRGRPKKTN